MATPKLTKEMRAYFASIGAKGGKQFTAKRKAQLKKIQSKGRATVTPKKLAHLRKITADRVAKQAKAAKQRKHGAKSIDEG
jgi:hypothetical protein